MSRQIICSEPTTHTGAYSISSPDCYVSFRHPLDNVVCGNYGYIDIMTRKSIFDWTDIEYIFKVFPGLFLKYMYA